MKKISYVILVFLSIIMVGCGTDQTKELENQMKENAKKYYQNFARFTSGESITYEVTLGMMKEINKGEEILEKNKFDLKAFEKSDCKDSTKATMKISKSGKIDSITVKLNCK